MELILTRDRFSSVDTTSVLVDATRPTMRICYMLEDVVRAGPKVHGRTAIPAGRYQVQITPSPRFKRPLPLLNVPGFEGIRIHAGNTHQHTEGCLLPGTQREALADGSQRVLGSRDAFDALFALLRRAEQLKDPVFITIQGAAP